MNIDSKDQEIEQAFIASWNMTDKIYADFFMDTPEFFQRNQLDPSELEALEGFVQLKSNRKRLKPILGLIAEMRQRGFDRQLRAGHAMDRLILSRSLKHGLRADQAALGIDIGMESGMTVMYWHKPDSSLEIMLDRVELTPEVEQLLVKLLVQPIN